MNPLKKKICKKLIKATTNKGSNFYKMYVQNLKYNIKGACIFHLILVGILSILILSIKNRRLGKRCLLNGQNPFSMTKVICRQSLITPMRY